MNTEIRKSIFEDLYLTVREKEKRLYPDEVIFSLPLVKKSHPHFKEWTIRTLSFNKLKDYLQKKNRPLQILDLGCGNGWMSNKLSEINDSVVTGADLNSFETAQAKRIFQNNKRVTFLSGDLYKNNLLQKNQFDIIVLAASIQYFPDLKVLIGQLTKWLRHGGEIHILDSPFYTEKNISLAKEASLNYYKALACIRMADFYHHHQWSELSRLQFKIMNRAWNDKILLKIFKTNKNYFPWIVIHKL